MMSMGPAPNPMILVPGFHITLLHLGSISQALGFVLSLCNTYTDSLNLIFGYFGG